MTTPTFNEREREVDKLKQQLEESRSAARLHEIQAIYWKKRAKEGFLSFDSPGELAIATICMISVLLHLVDLVRGTLAFIRCFELC